MINQSDLKNYKDIWVIAEFDEITKQIKNVTFELLSAAKKLSAELGCKVALVIIGQDNKKYFEDFKKYGAEIIYNINRKAVFMADPRKETLEEAEKKFLITIHRMKN